LPTAKNTQKRVRQRRSFCLFAIFECKHSLSIRALCIIGIAIRRDSSGWHPGAEMGTHPWISGSGGHAETGTSCGAAHREWKFAELGTPQKWVRFASIRTPTARLKGGNAELGTQMGRDADPLRRNGYGRQVGRLWRNRRRTQFCGDNLSANLSLPVYVTKSTHGAQKRVRFGPEHLWKSLWEQGVIPAETGSGLALKRVRYTAESGTALRRNEYGSTQNRVRQGAISA
jgi:hypothetical protein